MKYLRLTFVLSTLVTLVLGANVARAADKKQLQARFEQRYPQLLQYKSQGKIGETPAGTIEAVDAKYLSDASLKKLVADENSDRQELYNIIAKEENTTPQKVAELSAKHNYEKARPGDYLKQSDGTWKKK